MSAHQSQGRQGQGQQAAGGREDRGRLTRRDRIPAPTTADGRGEWLWRRRGTELPRLGIAESPRDASGPSDRLADSSDHPRRPAGDPARL